MAEKRSSDGNNDNQAFSSNHEKDINEINLEKAILSPSPLVVLIFKWLAHLQVEWPFI